MELIERQIIDPEGNVKTIFVKGGKPKMKEGEPVTLTHNKTGKTLTGVWRTASGNKIFVGKDGSQQIAPKHLSKEKEGGKSSKKESKSSGKLSEAAQGWYDRSEAAFKTMSSDEQKKNLKLIKEQSEKFKDSEYHADKVAASKKLLEKYGHILEDKPAEKKPESKKEPAKKKTKEVAAPKKNDKPITEKQSNPDKFKKPEHEKLKQYKDADALSKKRAGTLHQFGQLDKSKLTNEEKKKLEKLRNEFEYQLPTSKIENPESGRDRRYNNWMDKHQSNDGYDDKAIAEAYIQGIVEDYVESSDAEKLHDMMSKLVDKYHQGQDPKQTRLFKANTKLFIK